MVKTKGLSFHRTTRWVDYRSDGRRPNEQSSDSIGVDQKLLRSGGNAPLFTGKG